MRQHRLILLLVALAAALAIPAAGNTAPPTDPVHGPGCGDITLTDPDQAGPPVYRTTSTTPATVYALLTTAKPSCRGVTYTIYVYDESGSTLLTSQEYSGDRTTSAFSFTYAVPGAPTKVCIAATSSREGEVIDAAPNSGCEILRLDISPGGGGFE
jgi:hypothetical protein